MEPPLTPAIFAREQNVSRETLKRLETYVELLIKWNRRINLVGAQSLGDVWRRHILDSAQILPLLPKKVEALVDLGSGAGLPGLILAILGVPRVHLIESDARKAAFMAEAARLTDTEVQIHICRIADAPVSDADIVTARALSGLPTLITYASRFLKADGKCFFLKGARLSEEVAAAAQTCHFQETRHRSLTDPAGVVLQLENISREER